MAYTLASISTAGGKALKVVDTTSKIIYTFPAGVGVRVEQPTSGLATAYDVIITHNNVASLIIPIANITTIGGVAPAGNNYVTDSDSITAIMP